MANDNGDGAEINGDSTVENNHDRADKNKDRDESDQVDGDEKDDDRNFDEVQDKLVQILRFVRILFIITSLVRKQMLSLKPKF